MESVNREEIVPDYSALRGSYFLANLNGSIIYIIQSDLVYPNSWYPLQCVRIVKHADY